MGQVYGSWAPFNVFEPPNTQLYGPNPSVLLIGRVLSQWMWWGGQCKSNKGVLKIASTS